MTVRQNISSVGLFVIKWFRFYMVNVERWFLVIRKIVSKKSCLVTNILATVRQVVLEAREKYFECEVVRDDELSSLGITHGEGCEIVLVMRKTVSVKKSLVGYKDFLEITVGSKNISSVCDASCFVSMW